MLNDFSEAKTLVRYTIGDIEEPFEIDDAYIDYVVSKQDEDKGVEFVVWKSSIQCLQIIKAKYALQAARRRERQGGREVEENRKEKYEAVCDLLTWLENSPEVAGISTSSALPIFLGTTVERKQDLLNDGRFVKPSTKIGWFTDVSLTGKDFFDD